MSADITVIRGDSYTIDINYPDDLTGSTVAFTVNGGSNPTSDTTAVIKKDITEHLDAAGGKTRLQLDPEDTQGLPAGEYYYDVQVTAANGAKTSTPAAKLTLTADITRR